MAPITNGTGLKDVMDAAGFDYNKAGLFFAVATFLIWMIPGYIVSVSDASDGLITLDGYVIVVRLATRQLISLEPLVDNALIEEELEDRLTTPAELEERLLGIETSIRFFRKLHPVMNALLWPLYEDRLDRKTREIYRSIKARLRILSKSLNSANLAPQSTTTAAHASGTAHQRTNIVDSGARRVFASNLAAIACIDNAIGTVERRLSRQEMILDRLERGEDGLQIQLAGLRSTVDEISRKLLIIRPRLFSGPVIPQGRSSEGTTLVASSGAARRAMVTKEGYDVELTRPFTEDATATAAPAHSLTGLFEQQVDQDDLTTDDDAYSTASTQPYRPESLYGTRDETGSEDLVDQKYQAYVRSLMAYGVSGSLLTLCRNSLIWQLG